MLDLCWSLVQLKAIRLKQNLLFWSFSPPPPDSSEPLDFTSETKDMIEYGHYLRDLTEIMSETAQNTTRSPHTHSSFYSLAHSQPLSLGRSLPHSLTRCLSLPPSLPHSPSLTPSLPPSLPPPSLTRSHRHSVNQSMFVLAVYNGEVN